MCRIGSFFIIYNVCTVQYGVSCDICICQLLQVVYIALVCFLCATLGQQLEFVKHKDIDNFEGKHASDRLQWHDSEVRKQEWNHNFNRRGQNDFVEMVYVVFMNHLGMEYCYFMWLLSFCSVTLTRQKPKVSYSFWYFGILYSLWFWYDFQYVYFPNFSWDTVCTCIRCLMLLLDAPCAVR